MTLLVYGAYGYTGELIAEEAVERGLDPVLAGRDDLRVNHLAAELDCEGRAFALDDPDAVAASVEDATVVLNCAGPFVDTYRPLVEACIGTGTHYLDITGEIEVFEAISERDAAAAEAGVTLLPGVGFDVVPTDCTAFHLHERLPDATHLRLAFRALGTLSPGTAATAVEHLGEGGKVRRDGRIESVPPAHDARRIDFGDGPQTAVTVPWGDVSTAYHSTGIPNVEVYAAVPPAVKWTMRTGRFAGPVVGRDPVKSLVQRVVRATVPAPSERERREGSARVWGEATDGERRVVSRLETSEPYALTVDSATTVAERVLGGDAPPGYRTPSSAYGADFVLELDGVAGWFDE